MWLVCMIGYFYVRRQHAAGRGWMVHPNIVVGLGIVSMLNEPCIRERYTASKLEVSCYVVETTTDMLQEPIEIAKSC